MNPFGWSHAEWALVIAMLAGWAGRETLFQWRRRSKRRRR
jgi:hypothetical protein